jgi:hypothetical protein
MKYTLGVDINKEHIRYALAQPQTILEDIISDADKSAGTVYALPPQVDWGEQNEVTPVKDQRHFGVFLSLGITGALELAVLIEQNR